jgi:16S rRNA (guanine527-N7)-methyltransferase
MDAGIVFKYFPDLRENQRQQFALLEELYKDWNKKINVVSRKDIDELYLRHVLHSLGIAKVINFLPGTEVLDVGTGGGFPGIPLAIIFPEVQFTLIDSIAKKIRVVEEVVTGLGLENVQVVNSRVEQLDSRFDFVVSRAVAAMPTFVRWVRERIKKKSSNELKNGILYLKGGDLTDELTGFKQARVIALKEYFEEEFFETKSVVYLSI